MLKIPIDPAGAAGGLVAAVGAASCCVIPAALFAAGATGAGAAWFDAFGWLGAYRTILLGVAVVATAAGLYLQYRSYRGECAANGACAKPLTRRATFWLRGLALLFVGGVVVYG
jgi:mercuric ion transport protein